ncbi:uncharacterized protein LOC108674924 [Hyalella azteca]|uniref:Uncharacterized protein LOC108674924 n=1 Tax=Hyalella azteca TaxID=294128 RepID=A0A8B7NXF1_HYAAZ|nr:uncharacterized protein LOC108674924 [Hyalella azteca]
MESASPVNWLLDKSSSRRLLWCQRKNYFIWILQFLLLVCGVLSASLHGSKGAYRDSVSDVDQKLNVAVKFDSRTLRSDGVILNSTIPKFSEVPVVTLTKISPTSETSWVNIKEIIRLHTPFSKEKDSYGEESVRILEKFTKTNKIPAFAIENANGSVSELSAIETEVLNGHLFPDFHSTSAIFQKSKPRENVEDETCDEKGSESPVIEFYNESNLIPHAFEDAEQSSSTELYGNDVSMYFQDKICEDLVNTSTYSEVSNYVDLVDAPTYSDEIYEDLVDAPTNSDKVYDDLVDAPTNSDKFYEDLVDAPTYSDKIFEDFVDPVTLWTDNPNEGESDEDDIRDAAYAKHMESKYEVLHGFSLICKEENVHCHHPHVVSIEACEEVCSLLEMCRFIVYTTRVGRDHRCRLFDLTPFEMNITPHPEERATIYMLPLTVQPGVRKFDGRYYFIAKEKAIPSRAERACRHVSGFYHLTLLAFDQIAVISQIAREMMNTSLPTDDAVIMALIVGHKPLSDTFSNLARRVSRKLKFDAKLRALNNKFIHVAYSGSTFSNARHWRKYQILCQGDPFNLRGEASFYLNLQNWFKDSALNRHLQVPYPESPFGLEAGPNGDQPASSKESFKSESKSAFVNVSVDQISSLQTGNSMGHIITDVDSLEGNCQTQNEITIVEFNHSSEDAWKIKKTDEGDNDGVEIKDSDGVESKDGDGVESKDGDGVESKDGDGVESKDGDGVEAKDGDGVEAKDGDGVEAEDGDGVEAEDGDGVGFKDGVEHARASSNAVGRSLDASIYHLLNLLKFILIFINCFLCFQINMNNFHIQN